MQPMLSSVAAPNQGSAEAVPSLQIAVLEYAARAPTPAQAARDPARLALGGGYEAAAAGKAAPDRDGR